MERITIDGSIQFDRFWYHTDHLGSSNLITDEAGEVVQHLEYTPFGEVWLEEFPTGHGSRVTDHGFTGQRFDADTGLVFFPGRVYDPQLGRFLQPDPFIQDPLDPQTFNRYSYVRNNPLKYTDPSGYFLEFITIFIIVVTVSFLASAASFIAAETGHPRAAQRFAKVARISAQIAGYLVGYDVAGRGQDEGDGSAAPTSLVVTIAYATAQAATQNANVHRDMERRKAKSEERAAQLASRPLPLRVSRSRLVPSPQPPLVSQQQPVIVRMIPGPIGEPVPIRVDPLTGRATAGFPSTLPGTPPNLDDLNPAQGLRWTGRILNETGHPRVGRLLGMAGTVLEPGGPGKIIGMASFGAAGAIYGGGVGGPWGAIAGGIVVGAVGGWIGSWFDLPTAGIVE